MITVVFEYLAMLKKEKPQKRIWDELSAIEQYDNEWQDPVNRCDFRCGVSMGFGMILTQNFTGFVRVVRNPVDPESRMVQIFLAKRRPTDNFTRPFDNKNIFPDPTVVIGKITPTSLKIIKLKINCICKTEPNQTGSDPPIFVKF